MAVIWKYDLTVQGEQTVRMPTGSELLQVGDQDPMNPKTIQLWVLCDPDADRVERRFIIHGTGHSVDRRAMSYVGSVVTVWWAACLACLRSR